MYDQHVMDFYVDLEKLCDMPRYACAKLVNDLCPALFPSNVSNALVKLWYKSGKVPTAKVVQREAGKRVPPLCPPSCWSSSALWSRVSTVLRLCAHDRQAARSSHRWSRLCQRLQQVIKVLPIGLFGRFVCHIPIYHNKRRVQF